MKLLIKFPTRNRPDKFIEVLNLYYSMLSDTDNTEFIISCDLDDITMNNYDMKYKLSKYINLSVFYSENETKVDAINNNLANVDFDILLLASDDMIPKIYGYDSIIRQEMENNYPNYDGVLWFNDGLQGNRLNTLSILGREYYKRFNYIYHPSYKSVWCDNEFMDVANLLNKQIYINKIIIKHEHYSIGCCNKDETYIKNETFDIINYDKINYESRRKNNYK
jgi:hypothetical protein